MQNTPQSLGTQEAASFIGVKADTVKHWRKRHQGPPFIRAGRRIVYRTQDLIAWQEAHRVVPEIESGVYL